MGPHKCSKCIYFYLNEDVKYKFIYNALSDQYESWAYKIEMKESCGFNPEGVALDKQQPPCGEYKE